MSCYLHSTYDIIYLHIFCNEWVKLWFAFIQGGDHHSVSFMIYSPFLQQQSNKKWPKLKDAQNKYAICIQTNN